MRKTALLHIKFALCATRGSFSFLFIRCFGITQRGKENAGMGAETIHRREIRNNRAQLAYERDPGAWPPAAAAAAAAVTLEIRDSQDRRNIAGRKPTERGPRQCRPVSGSRHDCFNTLRFCSMSGRRDNPAVR